MKYPITAKRQAMLDTINWCEGSPRYDELFSYIPFNNLGPHPDQCIPFGDTCTTAAGRYQFLYSTWQDSISNLGIPDFMSAENQDQAAIERIYHRGALADVDMGNIESAVEKLSYEWASLPPGQYGQPIKSMEQVLNYYYDRLDELDQKNIVGLDITLVLVSIAIVTMLVLSLIYVFKILK